VIADAIVEIQARQLRDDRELRRRARARAPLRQAEVYAHELEELLLKGQRKVPAELAEEIRVFVQEQSPEIAPSLRDAVWMHAHRLLDLLFDLQEHFQREMPSPLATSISISDVA
jgi:hypothetical protein